MHNISMQSNVTAIILLGSAVPAGFKKIEPGTSLLPVCLRSASDVWCGGVVVFVSRDGSHRTLLQLITVTKALVCRPDARVCVSYVTQLSSDHCSYAVMLPRT